MNTEELKLARKTYRSAKKEREKLIELKEKLENLKTKQEETTEFDSMQYENIELVSLEKLLENSFYEIAANTKESKKIYVYMGSYYVPPYSKNNISRLIISKRTKRKLDDYTNKYRDIETNKDIFVKKIDIPKFEQSNNIIKVVVSISSKDRHGNIYFQIFKELQLQYFNMLTYTTQDKALTLLKKKSSNYKRKKNI